MGDIQDRPFSKNYSGLINQTVIAIGITVICVSSQEYMKRKRRGDRPPEGLGSRETWQFGYLYQGRCWARHPSPPSPAGWPLSWVVQAIKFPEDKLNELRGIDATLYIRWLRGCFWFCVLQTCTTFPILFPIHIEFSDGSASPKSMTRASITSLVGTKQGLSLLWIHICLLFWITITWMVTLVWIGSGAFRMRAQKLAAAAKRAASISSAEKDSQFHPHPHPGYPFQDVPSLERDHRNDGIRLRTIMVSNVPPQLRSEKDLREYFEYYMSRKVDKPSMGLTSSTQPGFINKSLAFIFNRAKRIPNHLPTLPTNLTAHPPVERDTPGDDNEPSDSTGSEPGNDTSSDIPVIDRVAIARKMTELASLLERREDILQRLETAHIKLAKKAVLDVFDALDKKRAHLPIYHKSNTAVTIAKVRAAANPGVSDVERGNPNLEDRAEGERRMEHIMQVLSPYVEEFGLQIPLSQRSKKRISRTSKLAFKKLHLNSPQDSDDSDPETPPSDNSAAYPPSPLPGRFVSPNMKMTVWEALFSLPRTSLDAYQPLVNLSHIFRGKTVPAIDYYTIKLNLLTSLITENRSKAVKDYQPVSTAFVTFADPADARRACKYLAVHPNNPLACMVTMAPGYEDLDWIRVMKQSYNVEFVKDWLVNIGVWAFTILWLFPVSIFVGLVSIQSISTLWPNLKNYLANHAWEEELLQSFLPTLLVSLLALLIPVILLLIAKKAHTITTLSALHDTIMTRYYKFLIVNVLVFFCVGTAALQSLVSSFKASPGSSLLNIVATSFPSAGPFYVGWLIFTTAIHGALELALFGLPLILYPSTKRQVTPRKRAAGIRPRTFNFYYWLPSHLLVIHILLLLSVLNPLVLPFGTIYFFIESGVVKNQLLHVYAKNYEKNGQILLIRMVRYSLDGLILSQAVFLAYMVVLKKNVNVGLAASLIVFTTIVKIYMTRVCRAQFESDDIAEARIICGGDTPQGEDSSSSTNENGDNANGGEQDNNGFVESAEAPRHSSIWSRRFPEWVNLSYKTIRHRPHNADRRQPNPFGPNRPHFQSQAESSSRLRSMSLDINEAVTDDVSVDVASRSTEALPPANHNRDDHTGIPHIPPVMDSSQWNGALATRLVEPHPSPVTWDDESSSDLPYDNPFYTRPIKDILWLPRNPFGLLNLDDTINLHKSLATTIAGGELGSWLGLQETVSPATVSSILNLQVTPPALESTGLPSSIRLEYTGAEEIDLPPAIANRVLSGDEDDVEEVIRPRRPSAFRRRGSNDQSTGSTGRRRPNFVGSPSTLNYRSFSAGTNRNRSASVMSTLEPPALDRARSADFELGLRPDVDAHAQAAFVMANASGTSVGQPQLSRAKNITVHDAIYHEVMKEEEAALIHRMEDEAAEAEKQTKSTRSWLTSWMFKKQEDT